MQRVFENGSWSLFDPKDTPELQDKYGEDFEAVYRTLERGDLAMNKMPARKLWDHIIDAQIETGMPWILFHDAMNGK